MVTSKISSPPATDNIAAGDPTTPHSKSKDSKIATIHIVGGEIGGSGKSTTCEALGCYYLMKKIPFIPIDCDRTTPNFIRAYGSDIYQSWQKVNHEFLLANNAATDESPGEETMEELLSKQIYFEEDEGSYLAARMITLASKFGRDLVVNLPAQCEKGLRQWIELYDIPRYQRDKSREFNLCIWFVTNGKKDSLNLFNKFYNDYQLPTVLVANKFTRGIDWDNYIYPEEINELINNGKIKEFKLQVLPLSPRAKDRTKPLCEMLDDKSIGTPDKMSIRRWLSVTHNQILATGFMGK